MKRKIPANKPTAVYQQFRGRARSDLNTSGLLSGLNELDLQMREYQEKREMKTSQSELELPICDRNINTGSKIKERMMNPYSDSKTERLNNSTLSTIAEFTTPTTKSSKPQLPMSNSTVMFKSSRQYSSKPLLSKPVTAVSKQKPIKQQKNGPLKSKTRQLQQQLLQAFADQPYKKNIINKQFLTLLKLLE